MRYELTIIPLLFLQTHRFVGGNNSCIGCDSVAYSGATYDICGICSGDGKSCLGCDGIELFLHMIFSPPFSHK